MKLLEIPAERIDFLDERFRISYHFDLDKLLVSIENIGLVNPPVVVDRGGPGYVIVSGWKRVAACIRLNMASIPVYLAEEKDDTRAFFINLYENMAVRNFDTLEKAEIVFKLKKLLEDEKTIVKKFFPLLGIPANLSYLDLYLDIARLEPGWKKIVHDKKIPLPSIQVLTEFTPKEREALIPLVLPLNMNKLKHFFQDLYDLSKKTGQTAKTILSQPEIQSICRSEKLSSLQKADRVRSLLRSKRYPTLSSWQRAVRLSLEKARLTKDVALDPTSFFEDGEFSVAFSLFDREAFLKKVSRLKELGADEDLFTMFENDPDG